jgi:hypothetical protein
LQFPERGVSSRSLALPYFAVNATAPGSLGAPWRTGGCTWTQGFFSG